MAAPPTRRPCVGGAAGIATSLLRSAAICQSVGMSGDNTTTLCTQGACAKSVEGLFSATHAAEYTNVTRLLDDLHVPSFVRRATQLL
eukprot:4041691-Prymnesium_polylepis.1